jgi:hypothetical protein
VSSLVCRPINTVEVGSVVPDLMFSGVLLGTYRLNPIGESLTGYRG